MVLNTFQKRAKRQSKKLFEKLSKSLKSPKSKPTLRTIPKHTCIFCLFSVFGTKELLFLSLFFRGKGEISLLPHTRSTTEWSTPPIPRQDSTTPRAPAPSGPLSTNFRVSLVTSTFSKRSQTINKGWIWIKVIEPLIV